MEQLKLKHHYLKGIQMLQQLTNSTKNLNPLTNCKYQSEAHYQSYTTNPRQLYKNLNQ